MGSPEAIRWATLGLWTAGFGFLLGTASWTGKTAEGRPASRPVLLLKMAGLLIPLYWPWSVAGWAGHPLYPGGPFPEAAGAFLCAAGLALAAGSRLQLGPNWSESVELKEGHERVVKGPYRLLRHPMYAGLDLAMTGTALAFGNRMGFLVAAFAALGTLVKARAEEKMPAKRFPRIYPAYSKRTKRLVPFVF
jgi:protein-S-isoprenylcysteine O-methyltransferase Ste14